MYKYSFLWAVIICLVASPCHSQNLEDELQDVFETFELMGMSVWVKTPDSQEQLHFGLRDYDRNLAMNSDTHYRIASVSKSFTALAVLKLYNDGLFDLDDDISDYLGYEVKNPSFPTTTITFRMLLSHTSSLQDGNGYNPFLQATFNVLPVPNISELLMPGGNYYTTNMWRTEAPGSHFAYSNINFGLLGTLIEKISGERFDVFMKNTILDPLDISGSYNIQDVPDINDVAVLYRNIGGWQPQADNYEGVLPSPPDLGNYIPGTNGVYFGPQGSLRITAGDTGKFLSFLSSNGADSALDISSETIQTMKDIAWDYNGANGDNYFGLFNRWGLGLHHANVNSGDQICNLGTYDSFIGHPGEAFGLVSDAYFNEEENISFALLINGIWNGYDIGTSSSFYTVEEAVFEALCSYFQTALTISDTTPITTTLTPNPTKDFFYVTINQPVKDLKYSIIDLQGRTTDKGMMDDVSGTFDTSKYAAGIHFLKLESQEFTEVLKFVVL